MSEHVRASLDAESQVLGACLISRSAVERAVAQVLPSDFYRPAHQRIFDAIVTLYQQGAPVDATTVSDALKQSHAAYEDTALLIELMANLISAGNVGTYLAIVRREASARCLNAATVEAQKALAGEADPVDVADALEEQIKSLDRGSRLPERYWRSVGDYQAAPPLSSTTPLWEGGCYPRTRALVLAEEKAGKSWILKQLAFCAAAGVSPFTFRSIEPVRCLILDAENDDSELLICMKRMSDALALSPQAGEGRPAIFSAPYGFDLRSRKDRSEVEAVLEDYHPQMVVGGPIYKLMPRKEKEDLDSHAAALQRVLDGFRRRFGCALVLEHHAPSARPNERRELRSKGGQIWAAWPEMTVALGKVKEGGREHLKVEMVHTPRGEFRWPSRFDRGGPGEWPWIPVLSGKSAEAATKGSEPRPIDFSEPRRLYDDEEEPF